MKRALRALKTIYLSHPSSSGLERPLELMRDITDAGYQIAYDWVGVIKEEIDRGKPYPPYRLRAEATKSIAACRICDAMVVAANDAGRLSTGCYIEVGAALSAGKPVILVARSKHFFFSHPLIIRVARWDMVVSRLDSSFSIRDNDVK